MWNRNLSTALLRREHKMELLMQVIYALAIGGIAGYFIGYFIKRLSHLAFIIGAFAFLLMYMVYNRAIDLNFEELGATVKKFVDALGPLGFTALASSAPFVGSFVIGFFLGIKRG
jgi:uncharacterized membrane protein (Fun14 family)